MKPAGHDQAYSEDEIKIIMNQSYEGDESNQTKLSYLENVFVFDERDAKDIMVPRTELITLNQDMTYDDIIPILDEHNYSRYPVIEDGDKDRIIGVVNVKKILPDMVATRTHQLSEFVREIPFVSEVTSIQDAMIKMQQERVHMAVVVDEYGGTSGIITMEDILEELVGEIRDEFDADEVADIQETGENQYLINGRVLLDELERQFGMVFEGNEEMDTVAGWIQYQKGVGVEKAIPWNTATMSGPLWMPRTITSSRCCLSVYRALRLKNLQAIWLKVKSLEYIFISKLNGGESLNLREVIGRNNSLEFIFSRCIYRFDRVFCWC